MRHPPPAPGTPPPPAGRSLPPGEPASPAAGRPAPSAEPGSLPAPSAGPGPPTPPPAIDPAPPAGPGPPAPDVRVHAALVVAQVCFGGFYVIGKAVMTEVPPLALAAIRVVLAAPLLAFLAWRHDRLLPARRDLPVLALLAALGVFGNQVLFVLGLQRTTAIHASILMPSMPVFAVLAAAALGIERIGPRRLAGVALSVCGALVLANPARLLAGGLGAAPAGAGGAGGAQAAGAVGSTALGNGLIVLNCICWAFFLVLQRPILRRLPWRTVIAWSFLLGTGPVVALAWPQLRALWPGAVSPLAWLGVAYVVLFATVVAYSISTWAVRRSSPALVAAYSTLQPVVATALAASFLGERFGWTEAAGFALIATGLWRLSASPPAAPGQPARSP
jgi:drug/metabolite transporter (DMT)-like permease